MMTVADIHNVTFEKSMRGYRSEDVDEFLANVAREFEELVRTRDEAVREKETVVSAAMRDKEETEKKMYILAEKIEQYRQDEDNLKTALLNAQRLGESVVHEARQKAEALVYDAKKKAAQMEQQMKDAVAAEEQRLVTIQTDVKNFKSHILALYKQHIDALNYVPSHIEKPVHPTASVAPTPSVMQPAVTAAFVAPAAVPSTTIADFVVESAAIAAMPVAPVEEKEAPVPPQPVLSPAESPVPAPEVFAPVTDKADAFDFSSLAGAIDAAEDVADSFENYQGIRFDD